MNLVRKKSFWYLSLFRVQILYFLLSAFSFNQLNKHLLNICYVHSYEVDEMKKISETECSSPGAYAQVEGLNAGNVIIQGLQKYKLLGCLKKENVHITEGEK